MPEWSPYAYTFINPVNYTDPTGMVPDTYLLNSKTGESTYIDDGSDDIVLLDDDSYNSAVTSGTKAYECAGECDNEAYNTYQGLLDGGNKVQGFAYTPFAELIAANESRGDYNIANRTKGGLRIVRGLNLTEMTISDLMDMQSSRDVFAIGKFQLIPTTLKESVLQLGLDSKAKFSEVMQDYIFSAYLVGGKRPQIRNYLRSGKGLSGAMYSAAKEWASIGVEAGRKISGGRTAQGGESYYAGDGLNKAHITPDQIKAVLINSRQ